jgi:putative ABC transport system ATP-binding protein
MIEIKNLSKSYGSKHSKIQVLKNFNLNLSPESLSVFYGKSGCGKSTLLNLLGRLDEVDEGEIIIDGKNICALTAEQAARFRLRNMGIVFQFFNLLPTLTLEENISIPGYLNKIHPKELKQRVQDSLKMTGLCSAAKRLPHQASGGEIQRAAIARSLINHPKIILADEPTGNLDENNKVQVMSIFKNLVLEKKITVIVVSHDESFSEICDHVFRLESGSLKS